MIPYMSDWPVLAPSCTSMRKSKAPDPLFVAVPKMLAWVGDEQVTP